MPSASADNAWSTPDLEQTKDLALPTDDAICYNGYTETWGTIDDVKAYDPDVISPEKGWVYLKPNSNWKKDNARFAIYLCNGSKTAVWYSLTHIDGTEYYGVKLPDNFSVQNYKNIIFCRMNPSSTENKWENKWNQSGDLDCNEIINGKNGCAIKANQWDCGNNVTWSTLTDLRN